MNRKSSLNGPTLWQGVFNDIKSHIDAETLPVGQQLPPLRALCDQYGVSSITVRTALRELADAQYLESRPRQGVFVKARRSHGDSSSLKREKVLALLLPSRDPSFYARLLLGVEKECRARDYRLIVCSTNEEAALEARHLLDMVGQVAGFLIVPARENHDYLAYAALIKAKVPFVFVDHSVEHLAASSIATDNEQGGYLATRHLIEIGRRRIFALSARQASSLEERLRGYRRALKESKIAFDPSLVRQLALSDDEVAGYLSTKELLGERVGGESIGVFALNDSLARGAYAAIRQARLCIPQDVAVVGYDDIFALYLEPPLTSVRQNPQGMGALAAQELMDILRFGGAGGGTASKRRSPQDVRLAPELVIRNSTDENSNFSLAGYFFNKAETQAKNEEDIHGCNKSPPAQQAAMLPLVRGTL